MHLLDKWCYDALTDVMALESDFIPKPARTVALLFQQPSTRTHLSFLTAVHCLGYTPLDLGSSTSMEKGESLADTLAVIAAMGIDIAVVRTCEDLAHTMRGWPEEACPVINAGDAHWHPNPSLGGRLHALPALRHDGLDRQDSGYHRRLAITGCAVH